MNCDNSYVTTREGGTNCPGRGAANCNRRRRQGTANVRLRGVVVLCRDGGSVPVLQRSDTAGSHELSCNIPVGSFGSPGRCRDPFALETDSRKAGAVYRQGKNSAGDLYWCATA